MWPLGLGLQDRAPPKDATGAGTRRALAWGAPRAHKGARGAGRGGEGGGGEGCGLPATCDCGSGPAAPLPRQPGPPARSPASFLSPLSLRTGPPGSISGIRLFASNPGRGRGAGGLGGAGLPPPLSPVLAPLGPARSARLTLRSAGRSCYCAPGPRRRRRRRRRQGGRAASGRRAGRTPAQHG
jgi:hypothetical protein